MAAGLALDFDLETELPVEFESVPLASENIADVDRQACFPGRLAGKSGIAAEKQSHELVIVSQLVDKAGTVAVKQEDGM